MNRLKYILWGSLSSLALKGYYICPREMLQDEMILLHRFALKKAHDARMRDLQMP